MLTANIIGGLGNQLFIIFTTISYSIKTKNPFWFFYSDNSPSITPRATYWNSFLKNLKPFVYTNIPPQISNIKEYIYSQNGLKYIEIPRMKYSHIVLNGYFQSYKYFEENYTQIHKLLKLNEMQTNMKYMYKDIYDFNNTISLHFRYGDYKKYPDVYHLMTHEYYKKSIEIILDKRDNKPTTVLFFHENKDIEDIKTVNDIIDNLRNIYPSLQFIETETTLQDWAQLLLMSCCADNIISNSTFSWWGAYFNSNPDKIITYPIDWYVGENNLALPDLIPEKWVGIECG